MPRSALTRYPDILTPVQASTHYTPLLIAYFAYVDLARIKPGQSVLITDASHCAGPSFVQLAIVGAEEVIAAGEVFHFETGVHRMGFPSQEHPFQNEIPHRRR